MDNMDKKNIEKIEKNKCKFNRNKEYNEFIYKPKKTGFYIYYGDESEDLNIIIALTGRKVDKKIYK